MNAAMFSVSTSDGRQEDPRVPRGYISRRSLTGLKAPRYSTMHDALPPNALQLYERDPRYVLACGGGHTLLQRSAKE